MKSCTAQWKKFTTAVVTALSVSLIMPAQSAANAEEDKQANARAESTAGPAKEVQAADKNADKAVDENTGKDADKRAETARNKNAAKDAEQEKAAKTNALKGITWEKRFADVDTDNNNAAEWAELSSAYQTELQNAQWGKQKSVDQFDRNGDGQLEEVEYFFFMSALAQDLKPAKTASDEQAQDQEQAQGPGREGAQEKGQALAQK